MTLKDGIAAIPQDTDLHMLLGGYYAERGLSDQAKAVYEEALTNAQEKGNTSLVTTIQTAIDDLK